MRRSIIASILYNIYKRNQNVCFAQRLKILWQIFQSKYLFTCASDFIWQGRMEHIRIFIWNTPFYALAICQWQILAVLTAGIELILHHTSINQLVSVLFFFFGWEGKTTAYLFQCLSGSELTVVKEKTSTNDTVDIYLPSINGRQKVHR